MLAFVYRKASDELLEVWSAREDTSFRKLRIHKAIYGRIEALVHAFSKEYHTTPTRWQRTLLDFPAYVKNFLPTQ